MNIGLSILDFALAVQNLLNGISVYHNKSKWNNWKLTFSINIFFAITLFAVGILLLMKEWIWS